MRPLLIAGWDNILVSFVSIASTANGNDTAVISSNLKNKAKFFMQAMVYKADG